MTQLDWKQYVKFQNGGNLLSAQDRQQLHLPGVDEIHEKYSTKSVQSSWVLKIEPMQTFFRPATFVIV